MLSRPLKWLLNITIAAWVLLLIAMVAFRVSLPYINHSRALIVEQLQQKFGISAEIGQITGKWHLFGPVFTINGIKADESKIAKLTADKVHIEFDVWRSLFHWNWQFRNLVFDNLMFDFQNEHQQGMTQLSVETISSLANFFFYQLEAFELQKSQVSFRSPSGKSVTLDIPQLQWVNSEQQHKAAGRVTLTSSNQENYGSLNVNINLRDNGNALLSEGELYLQADNVNAEPWLNEWLTEVIGIQEANFSLAAWLVWKNNRFSHANMKIDKGDFRWSYGHEEYQLATGEQWFYLTSEDDDYRTWQLFSPKLDLYSQKKPWPKSYVRVEWRYGDEVENNIRKMDNLKLQTGAFRVEDIATILPLFSSFNFTALNTLVALEPQGSVEQLSIEIPFESLEKTQFNVDWQALAWSEWENIPSVQQFSGFAKGTINEGNMAVAMPKGSLFLEELLEVPISVENIAGKVEWKKEASGGWLFWGEEIEAASSGTQIKGDFSLSLSEGHQMDLALVAGVHVKESRKISALYPHLRKTHPISEYLYRAIQAGEVRDATLLFRGDPKQYPKSVGEGLFQLSMPFHNVDFKFQPKWQPIKQAQGRIEIANTGLIAFVEKGLLGDVSLSNISISIPSFQDKQLFVDGDIKSKAKPIYDYLMHSPLQQKMGKALQQIKIEGDVEGNLQLHIPIKHSPNVSVKGGIKLLGNRVTLSSLGIQSDNTTGTLTFTEKSVSGEAIKGNWLGQPIAVGIQYQMLPSQKHKVDVLVNGNWSLEPLFTLPKTLKNAFSGQANWNSKIQVLFQRGSVKYQIEMNGKFRQLSQRLIQLTGDKQPALKMQVKGDSKKFHASGSLGKSRFNTAWRLANRRVELENAVFSNEGARIPLLPKQRALQLKLPALVGEDWVPLLALLNQKQAKQNKIKLPERIVISTPSFTYLGQNWRDFRTSIERKISSWNISFAAKELVATLIMYEKMPWRLDVNYLYYNPTVKRTTSSIETKLPKNLPLGNMKYGSRIAFNCQECWLVGHRIKSLSGELQHQREQVVLKQGRLDTGEVKLDVEGDIKTTLIGLQTSVKGNISGDNIERALSYFGQEAPIKNAPFSSKFNLKWQDAPWNFDASTLAGQLEIELKAGKISNVSGGHQILTLISLTTLLRKLQSDFNNTFGNDFAFDKISSKTDIYKGIFYTKDTLIAGVSAAIVLKGNVNLAEKRLNLEATITPALSSTVGVAAAIALNPLAGVALYTASYIFSPLWSKIPFLHYAITGSFSAPKISRIR